MIDAETQDLMDAMEEVYNLGVAMECYDEARKFWCEHFPELSLEELLSKTSSPERSLEDVIIQEVLDSDNVDDAKYAVKMLMAVVVYQMGFG